MFSIGLALSLISGQSTTETAVGLWILASNNWNDAGTWLDTAIWND